MALQMPRRMTGITDLLVMDQLSDGPKYPYQIIKGIFEKFGSRYKPSTGVIYPCLRRLQEKGYVRKDKRYYALTEQGKKVMEENRDVLDMRISGYFESREFYREFNNLALRVVRDVYNLTPEQVVRGGNEILDLTRKTLETIHRIMGRGGKDGNNHHQ